MDAENKRPPTVLSIESTVLAAVNSTDETHASVKFIGQTTLNSSANRTPTPFCTAQATGSDWASFTT